MEFGNSGMLNEDGIHVDMDRLKKGELRNVNHGNQLQGRRHIRRGQQNHNWRLHRQPRDGQADAGARHDLVLPVRLGGRHAGSRGHCALPAGDVRDPERRAADDAGGRGDVPGAVLQQQGPVKCWTDYRGLGRAPRRAGVLDPSGRIAAQAVEGFEEAEAVDFVKGALAEAIKWDGSSGGVIRMVVLTKAGAVRHLYLPDNGYKVNVA
ncbi:hypothetical protein V495_00648 [Pseudogymnoascus sp. VKM F-4514 (FW-929)]|nr:hypothetical protein V495_00648 [Pseudogymnoascus sp. VKM F-4514 (FW-929)]KFY65955.1 hypothetical protein V497_01212 [Pseudogymnoascus sp. VKM F-4516 (FW-969)]